MTAKGIPRQKEMDSIRSALKYLDEVILPEEMKKDRDEETIKILKFIRSNLEDRLNVIDPERKGSM